MDLPQQLGPYLLTRRLGRGGMAEVYLALAYGASGFEKKVAIKTLLPELRGSGEMERILIEEARMMARLQHRNLVQVHDLGIEDGTYYVRLDYVDGADLDTLLRRARPPQELALFIAEEVALGLSFVHGACDDAGRPLGLVHRDISPSNVLISRAGEVKLADFGIAKATLLADITGGKVRKGKYAYMSPEQVGGEDLTQRSDQFALGVVLYEMLCGRRPYDGDSVFDTMQRIRQATPPDQLADPASNHLAGDELSAAQKWLLGRCLARDPKDRFPSADALRQAIVAVRDNLAPVAPPDLGAWTTRLLTQEAKVVVAPEMLE